MKEYIFRTGANTLKNCAFRTPQRAIAQANDIAKATLGKVKVYEEIHLATPDTGEISEKIQDLIAASANRAIGTLTADISKITGIPPHIIKIELDMSESIGSKTEGWMNETKRQEAILDSIIEEPSRTLSKEPIPYEKIQHRADFLHNFKDGWALFNSNALFRTITMLVMNGASEYDLMLELIFMIDGHTIPGTSHLKPSHKQKPTDNEAK